jgi:membrane-bound serine protease (ClpP class)
VHLRGPLCAGNAVLLILALILALLLLSWPWNLVVVSLVGVCEVAVVWLAIRYTKRRRAQVGIETMIGTTAYVITALTPDGQVRVNGETWLARSEHAASVGKTVRITGVEGLILEVEPCQAGAEDGARARARAS